MYAQTVSFHCECMTGRLSPTIGSNTSAKRHFSMQPFLLHNALFRDDHAMDIFFLSFFHLIKYLIKMTVRLYADRGLAASYLPANYICMYMTMQHTVIIIFFF
jgi:hypothetical protein